MRVDFINETTGNFVASWHGPVPCVGECVSVAIACDGDATAKWYGDVTIEQWYRVVKREHLIDRTFTFGSNVTGDNDSVRVYVVETI
jgi:hypothetical protein